MSYTHFPSQSSHLILGAGAILVAMMSAATLSSACSSDATTPTPAVTDAGSSGTTTDSGSSGASADTGAPTIQGCRSFVNRSGESDKREIKWDLSVADTPEHCMQIKVGQKVTWGDGAGGKADFATHPLTASGGDTPSPISGAGATTGDATFDKAGTFGFQCGNHGNMVGAILVVP